MTQRVFRVPSRSRKGKMHKVYETAKGLKCTCEDFGWNVNIREKKSNCFHTDEIKKRYNLINLPREVNHDANQN